MVGGGRPPRYPGRRATPWLGWSRVPGGCRRTLDPSGALTAAATVTEHLRLGTGITLVAQHDPIVLAKTGLTVAEHQERTVASVLDLRSLVPLDEDAILDSVRRCSKVVILDEANEMCAAGAQVAALIAQKGFEDLDGPVVRVATPDVPIPFSPTLEQAVLPQVDDVREACRELLEY